MKKKQELRTTWFNHDATGRGDRYFKWWMGFLEKVVGDNGFSVGDKISLADVLLYTQLTDTAANLGNSSSRFGSLEMTNAALANYPKISKILANYAANENIQKWLAMRGDQTF